MEIETQSFLELRSIEDLPDLLQVSREIFRQALYGSQENYDCFRIAKSKGGSREIEAPQGVLKTIQRLLNVQLQAIYATVRPECSHGFISNFNKENKTCNIVSNAVVHVGSSQVLNLDLHHFFHSIDVWRVKRIFQAYPFYFGNDLASCLAILTTYQSRLPMGAPSSPVISNFACFLLDRKLLRFAADNQLRFTRYADDLTFSTPDRITAQHLQDILEIIRSEKFIINESKTRLQCKAGRQMVTGLKVNEKVNVDRKFIRSIRAMLHKWEITGKEKAAERNRSPEEFYNILRGKIEFLKMVRGGQDELYVSFAQRFRELANAGY